MCWFPLCWLHCWPDRFSGCSTWNTSCRGPTLCTCWWTICFQSSLVTDAIFCLFLVYISLNYYYLNHISKKVIISDHTWLIGFHCWWGASCRFVFWHISSASRKWSWERRPLHQIWKSILVAKALAAGLHNQGYGLATLELEFLGLFLPLHWVSQTFFAVWLFWRWKSFCWWSIFSFLPCLSRNVKCLNDCDL